ncbi:COX15/CtaA family protein [Microbacterium stercoris]|uniref:COX15/CtaA family protein n=1 Tax=Microbacterium stercoris TaxID=2820289 RepID=A0A939QI10_9MICO|nr:COX15/CtaA family protein [Microbacterium stercoris]MBO3662435.1 COX15/CtaA family protein [Microbacterium stercoris]MBO3664427.1 COX15/CtaA family protein [Microbacterium stercoris]
MSADVLAPANPARTAERVRPALIVLAWLSFIAEVIIIGTGGAVRLTGSGLGCSEWPLCTPESLVPTPELGIHGFIEFGNRTMTGVVGLLALAVLVLTLLHIRARRELIRTGWFALGGVVLAGATIAVSGSFVAGVAVALAAVIAAAVVTVRTAPARRDLLILSWLVVIGVVAQGLVGGITVLTGLNPFIVGFHYASSVALVVLTAAYLVRAYDAPGPRERAVPKWFAILTHVTSVALVATIGAGVLTTSNGPHSGDPNVIRTGFDATVLAHVHSWPGYVLLALTLALTAAALRLRLRPLRWLLALLAVIAVQVIVGIIQARNGLPELLVGVHMVLAGVSAAVFTVVVLRLKRPVSAD